MQLDAESGLLTGVPFIPSPNHNARPPNVMIDLLVIHGISLPPNQFNTQAIIDLFCNRLDYAQHDYYQTLIDLKVSSHLLITRQGKLIQFVPLHDRAWHAGVSQFKGREKCNDFSIGIELEGTDQIPYEENQYQLLAKVCRFLLKHYSIPSDRIVGHADIAPGRKTDPGESFNWEYLRQLL